MGATDESTYLASKFANWIEGLTFEELPPEIVSEAKAALRDYVGNAVSGATKPWMEPYRQAAPALFSPGNSTAILFPTTLAIRDAVLLNAVYGQAYEIDDVMSGHPSAVVVPTALALAEEHHLSGPELLLGIVVGYEIMYRCKAAIEPGEVRRGFQGTGLAGPFAATAVAGRLLGLSALQLTNAFGIAGNYACGMMEYALTGGECKRFYAGTSARAGIETAELAKYGLTGPPSVFEGKKGVFKTFGAEECDLSKSESGLGEDYAIKRRWTKAYSSVGGTHGSIDAMEALCEQYKFDPAEITSINVAVPHVAVSHGGSISIPWDLVSAQFSLAFSVAIRAIFRSNRIELYADPQSWSDPRVIALIEKVKVVEDPDAQDTPSGRVTMNIELASGASLRHVQEAPRGSPKNPLSPEELLKKYREQIEGLLKPAALDEIEIAFDQLESVSDLAPFVGLLGG